MSEPILTMTPTQSLTFPFPAASQAASRYCNGVEIRMSAFELQFEFAQLAPLFATQAEGEPVTLTKQVIERMAMSPQHAKAFLRILRENVEAYEASFGEIPDVVAIVEEQQKKSQEQE